MTRDELLADMRLWTQRMICLTYRVLPSDVGLSDPVGDSWVSLRLQRREDEKRTRRAPGDWAVMFDTAT